MADDAPKIIPFGKYKGRLVEELLVDDPAYLQWLAGQDWFRAKFTVLHQVIINRGAEPEETPDHNAMQVKFLDDDFCLRFLRYVVPDYAARARHEFNDARTNNLKQVAEKIEFQKKGLKQTEDDIASRRIEQSDYVLSLPSPRREQYVAERLDELRCQGQRYKDELLRLMCLHKALIVPVENAEFKFEREFEVRGIDVVLSVSTTSNEFVGQPDWWERYHHWYYGHWSQSFKIELKPTVGDDYPAVLRQMKANSSDVLLVGDYTGQGATQEQFVKTMATADIRVVFARDVEST